jgi:hypothetical protein
MMQVRTDKEKEFARLRDELSAGRVSESVTRHHEYDSTKGCGGLRLRLIHPTCCSFIGLAYRFGGMP